jgi:serine/threonine protein kinase
MDIRLSNKIKWFSDSKKLKLSVRREDNIFTMKGYDYEIRYLDDITGSSGGNSNVFMLCDPNDRENESEYFAVKICNTPIENSSNDYRKRFIREIIALNKVKKKSKNKFIIEYFDNGNFLLKNLTFPFYIMEKGDQNLTTYIQESELDVSEKIALCYYIIQGFCDLHALEIYHRDVKSGNFLMLENVCKIGDLGLADFRDMDNKLLIDEVGKKIGAFGWESPEVMNKLLTERTNSEFDCKIDFSSDIFQLGKLFWFILQGNLPIGLVNKDDFLTDDLELFELICKMLEHKKGADRRPVNVNEVKELFKPFAKKYSVI